MAARSFAAAALIVAYAVRLHDDLTDQAMADGRAIEKAAGLIAHYFKGCGTAICLTYGNIRFMRTLTRGNEMDTFFRRMKAMLTAFPFFVALLLSGCGSGCGTLGVANVSPCGSGASSATSTTSTFSVSGTVNGTVLLGVTINLTGAGTGSTTTDVNGNYSFTALPTGSYTVVPSFAGNTFNPASTAVTVSGGNVTGNNFTAAASTATTSSLSGTVSGAVAQNVVITLSGANQSGSAVTEANGNYSFSGLAAGSYTVTPSLTGYSFTPASTAVPTTSGETATGINFTEAAAP